MDGTIIITSLSFKSQAHEWWVQASRRSRRARKKCWERLHNFAKLDSLAISELRRRAVVWKFQRQTPFSQSVALSNYSFSHFTIAVRDFVFIVVVVFFGSASSRSLKLMPSTDHERGRQWCDGLNSTNRFAASSLTFCHRPEKLHFSLRLAKTKKQQASERSIIDHKSLLFFRRRSRLSHSHLFSFEKIDIFPLFTLIFLPPSRSMMMICRLFRFGFSAAASPPPPLFAICFVLEVRRRSSSSLKMMMIEATFKIASLFSPPDSLTFDRLDSADDCHHETFIASFSRYTSSIASYRARHVELWEENCRFVHKSESELQIIKSKHRENWSFSGRRNSPCGFMLTSSE